MSVGETEDQPSADATDMDSGAFHERVLIESKTRPRDVRRLPALLGEAVGLVWHTSRAGSLAVVAIQFVSALVAALQVYLGGLALRRLLDAPNAASITRVLPALILLALVIMVGGISTSGLSQFGRLLGVRVQRTVLARVLDVSSEVDLVTYEDPRFHDQLNRVLVNVPTRPYNVLTSLASIIGGVVGAVALSITLAVIQPLLVVLLLLAGLPLWWLSRKGGSLEFAFAMQQTSAVRERDYLSELLTRRESAAEVRAYGTQQVLRTRYERRYDEYQQGLRDLIRRRYQLNFLSTVATGIVTILTLTALVLLVRGSYIDVPAAAAAAVAIRLLAGRLQLLFGGLSTLFESALFLDDLAHFLDRAGEGGLRERAHMPISEDASVAAPQLLLPFRELCLQDVKFRYPAAGRNAVDGVSLTITTGQVIALVGENGSGKTTLAKLIAGLYHPASGTVSWNGELVDAASAPAIRDQVALVLQDFTRYQLSAQDNISFGRPTRETDPGRVMESAGRVGAHEFLAALPHGYDTRLSRQFSGGRELSQGQWQRVALARAFYRDAPLVILDEPTAALDPRAEARLYDSVREALADRTVLLITHRLASVRGADRILVLRDGCIVEDGSHTDLMASNGLYAELVGLQASRTISGALARSRHSKEGAA